jgi:hypothetical protein
MAKSFPRLASQGAFVPTTDVFDTQIIYSLDINSTEFKDFLVRLRQNINNIALSLNIRDAGYYDLQEFVNGQLFFPDPDLVANPAMAQQRTPVFRQVFRMVVDFGALPNTGTKSVAHGIFNVTSDFTFTRIYATASDTTGLTYIPIPFASSVDAEEIKIDVNATNVNITTGSNRTNYNVTYVILEYLKQ